MAGSYRHMTDDDGRLLGNERFTAMIENLGDAYEMAEECYGMIWNLADRIAGEHQTAESPDRGYRPGRADIRRIIEGARLTYRHGLETGGVSDDDQPGPNGQPS